MAVSLATRLQICQRCADTSGRDGFCPCPSDGEDIISHAKADECPQNKFVDGTAKGLGDVVASVLKSVGIKPCEGCKKRQEALNTLGEAVKGLIQ